MPLSLELELTGTTPERYKDGCAIDSSSQIAALYGYSVVKHVFEPTPKVYKGVLEVAPLLLGMELSGITPECYWFVDAIDC